MTRLELVCLSAMKMFSDHQIGDESRHIIEYSFVKGEAKDSYNILIKDMTFRFVRYTPVSNTKVTT